MPDPLEQKQNWVNLLNKYVLDAHAVLVFLRIRKIFTQSQKKICHTSTQSYMYIVSPAKAQFLETNKIPGFNEPVIPTLEKHWSI